MINGKPNAERFAQLVMAQGDQMGADLREAFSMFFYRLDKDIKRFIEEAETQ